MRHVLHLILAVVRAVVLISAGLGVMLAVAADEVGLVSGVGLWPTALRAAEAAPRIALGGGCGLLLIEILYWLTTARRPRSTTELSYQGPLGDVTVDTSLVVAELRRLVDEYPEILQLEPTVHPRRNSMDLDVDLKIRSGCASAPLCRALHDRLTELIGERFGMFEMGEVRLHIREIVREGSAAAPARPLETAPPGPREEAGMAASEEPEAGERPAGEFAPPETPPRA